jgi:pimeloyl-ACP methyl ester carboxylesterase
MSNPPTTRPSRRRLGARVLVLALVTALAGVVAASTATRASADNGARPTVVLVHGAFSGPSAWDRVVAGLQKDGYDTVTPALGLHGVAGDVATVRAALDSIAGPKLLVAHSYGGFVASNAAAGRTDVDGIVYTAAFVPEEGETINDLGAGYAPPAFLEPPFPPGHLLFDQDGLAVIDPAHFRADFAQDLNPKLAAALAAAQTPTDLGILFTPSGPVGWHTIPTWYAVSGADRIIDPALQRAMAARAHSTTVTFDDASHAGGFTHYATRLVKLVEVAALRPRRRSGPR